MSYPESIRNLRRKQNRVLTIVSLFANIFVIILPGLLDYENNIFFNFLAEHQIWTIIILIISTLSLIYINLNRPITE